MRRLVKWRERITSVPGLGRDIGVLVVLTAMAIGTAGYIWSQYGWIPPWQDRYTVTAEFAYADGLRPASRQEVRIAGVTVGKIVSVEPGEDGVARVTMSLEPGHPVYDNARAVLRSKAPVKLMYLALDPGGPPGDRLPDGGTIPVSQTQRPTAPFEVLDKLDERTQAAITSLIDNSDLALTNGQRTLPAGLRATERTVASLRPVVEQLATRRARIARLVSSLSTIATAVGHDDNRLAHLTSELQSTLRVMSKRNDELDRTLAQLPGLNGDLRRAMTGTRRLSDNLDPVLDGLHEAAHDLPVALRRLRSTVRKADTLMVEARPVVRKARPVIADLRPLSRDLTVSLGDLARVTRLLPGATGRIVPWLNDLAAFVYQTSSVFGLHDGSGGWGRGNVQVVLPSGATSSEPSARSRR